MMARRRARIALSFAAVCLGAAGLGAGCGSSGEETPPVCIACDAGSDDTAIETDAGVIREASADVVHDGRSDAESDAATFLCSGDAGTLGSSFGDGGVAVVPISGTGANAVAVLPSGAVLVGGYLPGNKRFALARLASSGALDSTFADGGVAETTFPLGSRGVTALAVLADGRILAAGVAGLSASNVAFAVVRYQSTGEVDATFGNSGIAVADFGPYDSNVSSLVVMPDGRFLVSGTTGDGTSTAGTDFAVARFLSNGTLDPTFGSGGVATIDIRQSEDTPGSMALQSDGRLVLVGGSTQEPARLIHDFSAVRLKTDGSLDTSFGTDGRVVTDFGSGDQRAFGVALDPAGRILLVGRSHSATTGDDMALVRLTTNGAVDTGFGTQGMTTLDFDGQNETLGRIVVQPDGKVVGVGSTFPAGGLASIALARFQSNGTPDPTFGDAGRVRTTVPGFLSVSANSLARESCTLTVAGSWTPDQGTLTTWMGVARYGL